MKKGIIVRRPNGAVVFDSSTPITFVIGKVKTGYGTNGSIEIPDVGAEKYFCYITGVFKNSNPPITNRGASGIDIPSLSIKGRSLSWEFSIESGGASVEITYAGYSS